MSIASAATVTTKETVFECKLAIHTLRKFHAVPVYIACDTQEVANEFKDMGDTKTFIVSFARPDVKTHNNYHRPDAISEKMPIMRRAMEEHPNVLFFDADIVFMGGLKISPNVELMLSLNLAVTPDMNLTVGKFGLFNAGLLWTKSNDFIDFWEKEYLNPSVKESFYEQSCLGLAPTRFSTDYFDTMHNWGHWRGSVLPRRALSYHVHLTDGVPCTLSVLNTRTRRLRPTVWNNFDKDTARTARSYLRHPKKIFFIHYGKCAGVYINESFKLVKGYDVLDPWTLGMGRDWTSEELSERLNDETPWRYIHQHHVNVREENLVTAKENEWETIMFYRDPREIIASLYYWSNSVVKKTGFCQVFREVSQPISFDEFFNRILKLPTLWALPKWHRLVGTCLPFNQVNLDSVFYKFFSHDHLPHGRRNASENPGWRATMNKQQLDKLQNTDDFKRSVAWLEEKSTFPSSLIIST
jgi:hypothetical protein